jgi:hypothetical protein
MKPPDLHPISLKAHRWVICMPATDRRHMPKRGCLVRSLDFAVGS